MRLRTCKRCHQLFEPNAKEEICEQCSEPVEIQVGKCIIREAPGRCREHLSGFCCDCLMVTAVLDWEGWEKVMEVDDVIEAQRGMSRDRVSLQKELYSLTKGKEGCGVYTNIKN